MITIFPSFGYFCKRNALNPNVHDSEHENLGFPTNTYQIFGRMRFMAIIIGGASVTFKSWVNILTVFMNFNDSITKFNITYYANHKKKF